MDRCEHDGRCWKARIRGNLYRGFESLSLRQHAKTAPAANAGAALVWLRGLVNDDEHRSV